MRQRSRPDEQPRTRTLPSAFAVAATLAASALVTSAVPAAAAWAATAPAPGSLSAGPISGTSAVSAHLPPGSLQASGKITPPATLPNVGEWSGMDAVSASDVWAVGGSYAEHYNGKSWRVIATPSISGGVLASVSADSAHDAWAVGYIQVGTTFTPLAEHWNGKRWAEVTVPSLSTTETIVTSVAAVSPTDAWAAGYYVTTSSQDAAFVDHWDGKTWTTISSADPGEVSTLTGISADSAHDAWATGLFAEPEGPIETFAEHWNGTSWAQVTTPNAPNPGSSDLVAVTALSPTNAWAVGYSSPAGPGGDQNLVEHWNGHKWRIKASPNPANATGSFPFAVSAYSANDIWAVGSYEVASGEYLNLAEHWSGKQWTATAVPNPSDSMNYLFAIAAATKHPWAGGFYETSGGSYVSSMFHWNGTKWVRKQKGVG